MKIQQKLIIQTKYVQQLNYKNQEVLYFIRITKMINKYSPKHNKIDVQFINSNVYQVLHRNQRQYSRQKINNVYYRKVIISLKQLDTKQIDLTVNNKTQLTQQEIKINQEYYLLQPIKSSYVVKNLTKAMERNKIIWIQQDYDCFLKDFSFENLNLKKRIKIFFCIAYGVRDIHSKLIVHGSLSPNTIAIARKNQQDIIAKINCFQYAMVLKNQKQKIQQIVIIPDNYSAPEIIKKCNYGLTADIWSLGCLLNYILYETLQNIWQTDQQTHIEVPDGTPDWLLQLLRSMLHYNPHKRYTIQTIIAIIKSSEKCIDTLGKYISIGKKNLKLQKIPSKLNFQRNI